MSVNIQKIDAIAWDLDGTLIDSFDLYLVVARELCEKFDLVMPSRQSMIENYHGSLEETLRITFGIDDPKLLQEILLEFMKIQTLHYEKDVDNHFFEDAVKLAENANNQSIKQIVVTNREHKGRGHGSPHSIVGRSRISNFIHEIRCRDQVEFAKPDARVLHDWLEAHTVNPENLLVIGDQFVDAKLALNLNARAVLVKRNGDIPHLDTLGNIDGRVFVVDSLHDVNVEKNE